MPQHPKRMHHSAGVAMVASPHHHQSSAPQPSQAIMAHAHHPAGGEPVPLWGPTTPRATLPGGTWSTLLAIGAMAGRSESRGVSRSGGRGSHGSEQWMGWIKSDGREKHHEQTHALDFKAFCNLVTETWFELISLLKCYDSPGEQHTP